MQSEFQFSPADDGQGYTRWLAARRDAARELARRLNLPLGRQVEVWLIGGIRLKGRLLLREEQLFVEEDRIRDIQLMVDHVVFTSSELESCVCLD